MSWIGPDASTKVNVKSVSPLAAQYSFLANGLSPDPKTQVRAARSSNDKVVIRTAADQHEIETPAPVRQIAVTCNGLWCLTENRDLYLWRGLKQSPTWKEMSPLQTDSSIDSITCYRDGRLHVSFVDESELLFDATQQNWSVPRDQVGHQQRTLTKTVSDSKADELSFLKDTPPAKPGRRKTWFRFSIRTCLLGFLILAAILGPISYLRDGFETRQAVEILKAQGHKIVFHHEVDAQGQPVKNPQSPSPAWLDRLFGPNLMDRPFSFEQSLIPNSVDPAPIAIQRLSRLVSLRELKVSHLDDLSCIKNLTRLEELDLSQFEVKDNFGKEIAWDLDWLKSLRNLKRLNLGGLMKTKGPVPLEHLKLLEQLNIGHWNSEDEKARLPAISKCSRLRKLTFGSQHLKEQGRQLLKLTELESLKIGSCVIPREFLSQLSGFKNLSELELDAKVEDVQWVEKCKNLKSLKLTGMGVISDFSALKNLKLLVELWLPVNEEHLLEDSILKSLPKLALDRVQLAETTSTGQSGGIFIESEGGFNYSLTTIPRISPSAIKPSVKFAVLNPEISDLSPLQGVRLRGIRGHCPALTDLSPLSGAPLNSVDLEGTGIADIKPVVNPELNTLIIAGTQVKSLNALKTQTFRGSLVLDISNTQIEDLSPIQGLKMSKFEGANTPISDVSALKTSRGIHSLDLSGTKVKDLKALNSFNDLEILKLADTQIRRLPKFNPKKIEHLDLSNTLIEDLTEFKSLPDLRYFNISGTKISDVSFVTGYRLNYFIADKTMLTGKDLAQISFYRTYDISLKATKIEDLNWLGNPRHLYDLDVSETKVSDLSPLSKLVDLREVYLSDTQVKDLGPLKQMTYLKVLSLPPGTNYSTAIREKYWRYLERVEIEGKVVWEKGSLDE